MVVNFALKNKVDFLLFGGDAYKTNKPLEEYRVMFREQITRAAKAGITCVLIPGNHDMTRRSTAEHCLAEFRHHENIILVDTPTLLEFPTVNIYALPWQYDKFPEPKLKLNKFTICIAHCTVLGAVFQSGQTAEVNLGRDFGVNLDFFTQFDVTCLGHIHRTQVLNEQPFVGYPGSSEWLTWGELGEPHGFYYYDGQITHIPYNHRPRVKLKWRKGVKVDPETSYEVTCDEVDINAVQQHFKTAFELKVIPIYKRHTVNRGIKIDDKMTKEEILGEYLGDIFKELTDEWNEVRAAVEQVG
jgi:DNA repair exonuclease SbcCD nuclease subunit